MDSKPLSEREKLLVEAARLISDDRDEDYGDPLSNFSRIARMFNCYKGAEFTKLEPEDIAVINILQKISRISNTPEHGDSWTDIAGYAALGYEVTLKKED